MNKPFFEMIQDKVGTKYPLHSVESEDRDVKITADFKMFVEPDLEYEEELKEVLEAKEVVSKEKYTIPNPVKSNQLNAGMDYIKDIYLKFFNEFEKLDICLRGAAAFDTPASKVFAKRKILEDLTNNLLALWSIESQIEENNEIKNKLERIKNEL